MKNPITRSLIVLAVFLVLGFIFVEFGAEIIYTTSSLVFVGVGVALIVIGLVGFFVLRNRENDNGLMLFAVLAFIVGLSILTAPLLRQMAVKCYSKGGTTYELFYGGAGAAEFCNDSEGNRIY